MKEGNGPNGWLTISHSTKSNDKCFTCDYRHQRRLWRCNCFPYSMHWGTRRYFSEQWKNFYNWMTRGNRERLIVSMEYVVGDNVTSGSRFVTIHESPHNVHILYGRGYVWYVGDSENHHGKWIWTKIRSSDFSYEYFMKVTGICGIWIDDSWRYTFKAQSTTMDGWIFVCLAHFIKLFSVWLRAKIQNVSWPTTYDVPRGECYIFFFLFRC